MIVGNGNAAPKPSGAAVDPAVPGDAMGQQTASYRVRLARPDEVTRLRAIEDAAGRIFSGLGLIDEALDVSFPLETWLVWSAWGRSGWAAWRTTCRWAW